MANTRFDFLRVLKYAGVIIGVDARAKTIINVVRDFDGFFETIYAQNADDGSKDLFFSDAMVG